jgi:hypothetical protein
VGFCGVQARKENRKSYLVSFYILCAPLFEHNILLFSEIKTQFCVLKLSTLNRESSYDRFVNGESTQAIAMAPANGRIIQVSTVCGHIQDAFLLGRPVDLHRLTSISQLPSKSEWVQLEQAEESTGMNAAGNPSTSGVCNGQFTMTDFLRQIIGDDFINTPREERSEQDKVKFGEWCNFLKWYIFLKRSGFEPSFGDE